MTMRALCGTLIVRGRDDRKKSLRGQYRQQKVVDNNISVLLQPIIHDHQFRESPQTRKSNQKLINLTSHLHWREIDNELLPQFAFETLFALC